MTRKDFLKAAAGAAAAPALLSQTKKRNLIFILTDDHRFDAMSCMGHPWLRTPNIDRLVQRGVLFQNSFVTTSLCSPSRASILTGQYAHAHRVLDNVTPLSQNLTTFPQVLQQNGYRTALIGKWHMGGDTDAPRPGFDHWISFRGQGQYFDPVLNYNGNRRKVNGYVTDILRDESLKFIRENSGRPFLLYLGNKAVHDDFRPAPRHKDLYSNLPVPFPKTMANTEENYRGKPDWVRKQRNSWHGVDGMYDNRYKGGLEELYRDYMRTLVAVDESVGAITNELEQKGLLNDTLIVYMGDNGFMLGEHGLVDKRAMYEASMRVPMFAHCPDLFDGGRRPDGMALNIDICPTMLDAAGLPAPRTVQGRSLLPLARGTSDWRTDFLYEYYWERDYPQTPTVLGLRTDQYSFMHYHGIWDLDELYDIRKDPGQSNNLLGDVRITTQGGRLFNRIKDPHLKSLVSDFQNRIAKSMQATGGRVEPTWSAHPA